MWFPAFYVCVFVYVWILRVILRVGVIGLRCFGRTFVRFVYNTSVAFVRVLGLLRVFFGWFPAFLSIFYASFCVIGAALRAA